MFQEATRESRRSQKIQRPVVPAAQSLFRSTVRVSDFSSAFNTILYYTVHLSLPRDKLSAVHVDSTLVSWVTDCLTGRPPVQITGLCVRADRKQHRFATGTCFCSFFLSLFYTSDFSYLSKTCLLQKFSDDTAILGCICDGKEGEYRSLVDNFVDWCQHNQVKCQEDKGAGGGFLEKEASSCSCHQPGGLH